MLGAAVAPAAAAAPSGLGKHADERRGGQRAADGDGDGAEAGLGGLLAVGVRRGDGDRLRLRGAPAPARAPADEAVEAAEAVPAAVGPHEPGRAVERAPRHRHHAARPRLGPAVRRRPGRPVLAVVGAVRPAPLLAASVTAGTVAAAAAGAEEASAAPAAGRGPCYGPA